MATAQLQVDNVTCGHCTRTIEREVGELEGVQSVRATEDGTVELQLDSPEVLEEARTLLAEINYPPRG